MSKADVATRPIYAALDAVDWLFRQFDRIPYAVLAIPLRVAVATVSGIPA